MHHRFEQRLSLPRVHLHSLKKAQQWTPPIYYINRLSQAIIHTVSGLVVTLECY